MGISIGPSDLYSSLSGITNSSAKTDNIETTLKNSSATDEELMNACKSFESYLMEQVFKSMESTVDKSEDEENNDYLNQFGDMMYEKVAEDSTENQSIGLAQMLYDSMKRNS